MNYTLTHENEIAILCAAGYRVMSVEEWLQELDRQRHAAYRNAASCDHDSCSVADDPRYCAYGSRAWNRLASFLEYGKCLFAGPPADIDPTLLWQQFTEIDPSEVGLALEKLEIAVPTSARELLAAITPTGASPAPRRSQDPWVNSIVMGPVMP